MSDPTIQWRCRSRTLTIGPRPLLMGILNVTPDSFSDGGVHASTTAAIDHALRMRDEGVDIIDVGGESTRPGAPAVPADEELRRVLPVISAICERTDIPVSIDTTKASVAAEALSAGAVIVNDVSACSADAAMPDLAARHGAGVVLMHMQGTPRTMQNDPKYTDVVAEVAAFLAGRAADMEKAGLPRECIAVDPGIGFGKTLEHNLALLANLEAIAPSKRPVVVGLSRKSFLGAITGQPVQSRLAASIAGAVFCALKGATILRVHDVRETRDAIAVAIAIAQGKACF